MIWAWCYLMMVVLFHRFITERFSEQSLILYFAQAEKVLKKLNLFNEIITNEWFYIQRNFACGACGRSNYKCKEIITHERFHNQKIWPTALVLITNLNFLWKGPTRHIFKFVTYGDCFKSNAFDWAKVYLH